LGLKRKQKYNIETDEEIMAGRDDNDLFGW